MDFFLLVEVREDGTRSQPMNVGQAMAQNKDALHRLRVLLGNLFRHKDQIAASQLGFGDVPVGSEAE